MDVVVTGNGSGPADDGNGPTSIVTTGDGAGDGSSRTSDDAMLATMSVVDYLKWADSLVGRDWEIFWVEDEDAGSSSGDDAGNDEEEKGGAKVEQDHHDENDDDDDDEATGPITTATGQETAEEEGKDKAQGGGSHGDDTPLDSTSKLDGEAVANTEGLTAAADVVLDEKTSDSGQANADDSIKKAENAKNGSDDKEDTDDDEDEGSVIDDWYDGHVIALNKPELPPRRGKRDRTKTDASSPASAAALAADLTFQVLFVGEEDIYKVSLVPSKVRPSARGWLKRSIALLNPEAGGKNGLKKDTPTWESRLPPDTRTFDDEAALQAIESNVLGGSNYTAGKISVWCSMPEESVNSPNKVASLPKADDLHQIQRLRVMLQAQIFLRGKLAKIENHKGASMFTNGIRNPTEPYVNHLVQCCKDLDLACAWYTKSWALLQYFFGTATAESACMGLDEQARLDQLTFDSLMCEYMDFGKDSIVNSAMIDATGSSSSSKRRHPLSLNGGGTTRRTKRRRKQNLKIEDDFLGFQSHHESNLDEDMRSRASVDQFIRAIGESNRCWYIEIFGNMLQAISHLVVDPLVAWRSQAGLILGREDDIMNDSSNATRAASVLSRDETPPKPQRHSGSNTDSQKTAREPLGQRETQVPDSMTGESQDITMKEVVGDVDLKATTGSADDDDLYSDDEVEEVSFCYEEIQECVSAIRNSRVLSRFNLFDDVHKLHAKLHDIEKSEENATALLNRLAEDIPYQNKSHDEVLIGLNEILRQMESPTSTLHNVDPLGRRKSGMPGVGTPITREELLAAAKLREWFDDVAHVKSVRERQSFVRDLMSKIELSLVPNPMDILALAGNPSVAECREQTMRSVRDLSRSLEKYQDAINDMQDDLVEKAIQGTDASDLRLQLDSLKAGLSVLTNYPVISLVDEKIAARIDVINWHSKASDLLLKLSNSAVKTLGFDEINSMYDSFQTVVRGKAETRSNLLRDVDPNDTIDHEISIFATNDVNQLCGSTGPEISKLYTSVKSWKERADSILSCLRMHANPLAGNILSAHKLPAMVDIKRIDDLIEEDTVNQILVPGYGDALRSIQSEAYEWSARLQSALTDETTPIASCLSIVEWARDHRPRGIVQNPTRAVIDNLVDLLSWYTKTHGAMESVWNDLSHWSDQGSSKTVAEKYSSRIIESIYPLLADGAEALELFCAEYTKAKGITAQFKAKSGRCLEILETQFRHRKSSRFLSREKLQCNEMIGIVFSRMVDSDESQGFTFQLMLWFHWHLFVTDFVASCDDPDGVGLPNKRVQSLTTAKELRSQEPFVADNVDLSNAPVLTKMLIRTKTLDLIALDRLISDAESIEISMKETFAKAKDLLRGSMHKAETVREHFLKLKEFLLIVKARELGKGGLSLNSMLETQIEHHIKIFGWLVRTFQYPLLHQNEALYSSSATESSSDSDCERIPWDVLISLNDKIPSDADASGDFALCTMRVKDLYAAATRWQEEISRTTLISNRGNKRRAPKLVSPDSPAGKAESHDAENAAKLQMQNMELLAKDSILSKVDMPREKAVRSMIQNSREFEIQLRNFLAQDYNGANQDKAPFPIGDSLVARNGQFILYRLTGSPLFAIMQSSMRSLSQVGNNVFAETPGKAAFDWMSSAVAWIEHLHESVTSDSHFPNCKTRILGIPAKDGKTLCCTGEEIFLQATDDVRQTLSNHGIYISTSALKKKLRVTLKKDGAHHSVGGTVIRWCPILFNALRADVSRLEAWENSLNKIYEEFNAFYAKTRNDPKDDEGNLFRWYSFREKIRVAMDEGEHSLVVFPAKNLVDSFCSLLNTIQQWLEKNSTDELNNRFAKRLFAQSTSLYDDRFRLLDSLLSRRAAARSLDDDGDTETSFGSHDSEKTFRDICMISLENAFGRAAATLNLSSAGISDVDDICALKAWEIENEMYELFQEELGLSRVSDEYRNKARSLKSNLDNVNNGDLCLRVLIGDITVPALIKMSPDQLASQKAKLDRENAKIAALKDTVLTPDALAEKDSDEIQYQNTNPVKHSPPSPSVKPSISILKVKTPVPAFNHPESDDEEEDIPDPTFDDDEDADGAPTLDGEELATSEHPPISSSTESTKVAVASGSQKLSSPTPMKPVLRQSTAAALTASREIGQTTSVSSRPPPPPSLAAMKASSPDHEPPADRVRGQRICNGSGGSSFRIEIQGSSKHIFQAAFYLDDDSHVDIIRGTMPETLTQKGRSKIEEFNRFVSEKLHGGRWIATSLRLTTISDKDAMVYKRFYKEFEAKERIAMFKLNEESGSKLFLVTPKFHGAAKRTGLISFPTKNSTYGIVLTKKG